jgi:hypothetical protein
MTFFKASSRRRATSRERLTAKMIRALPIKLWLQLALFATLAMSALGASAIKLDGTWITAKDEKHQTLQLIRIQPLGADSGLNTKNRLIQHDSPALSKAKLIELRTVEGNKPVSFDRVVEEKEKANPNEPLLRILLKITDAKAAGQKLNITIHDTEDGKPGLNLADSSHQVVGYEKEIVVPVPTKSTTDMGPTRFDLTDFQQHFLSVLSGGTEGAIVSGKLNANLGRVFTVRDTDIFVRGKATADVQIKNGDQTTDYFNSVVGALDSFIEHPFNRPIQGSGTEEIGLRSKFESDQSFRTMNATIGLSYWTTIDNSVTRGINHLFYLSPDRDQRSFLAPAIVIGYDYVGKIESGDGSSARRVETSRHRLSGHLDWPIEIINALDLKKTPLGAVYDVDLLVDVTPYFDLVNNKFLVEEKISLEIVPAVDKNKASLIVTFANGKATPTFKNVNTIVAGLKIPF